MTELVAERVEKSQGRMSAKRMLPIARAAGYDGSARNFRRLVAEAKALWRNEHHRGRRPAVWSPGEYLVIDWAEAAPGLFLFCAVLAFSRWRFVAFATDQRASHDAGVDRRGARPRSVVSRPGCWPTGWRCLKGGVVANVVVPTPDYVRLAGHYGFAPDFCHADDPAVQGHRGEPVRLRPTRPGGPAADRGRHRPAQPVDLRAANTAATAWCAEVNAAVHSEICAVPDERLVIERELLQPLPSLRLQIGAPSVIRKVDRLSCVRYASARYSVPTRLIGTTVAVVVDHGAVCLVEPATGMIVAEHELAAPGSRVDPRRPLRRATPSTEPRATTRKPATETTVLRTRRGRGGVPGRGRRDRQHPAGRRSWRSCSALGAAHGTDALVAALRRAVAFRRFRAADVRSILAAGAGTPTTPPRRGCVDPGPAGRPDPLAGRLQRSPRPPTAVRRHDHTHQRRQPNPLHRPRFRRWRPISTPGCAGSNWPRSAAPPPRCCSPPRPNAGPPRKCCGPWSRPSWPPGMPPTSSTGSRPPAFPVTKTLDSFDVGRLLDPAEGVRLPVQPGMDSRTTEPGDHRTRRHRQVAHPDRPRASPPIHAGHKVRYFTAADLVETLYRGLADNTVGKIIESLLRVDLIILDELGFAPLDDTGTQLLFRLVAGAYERRSLAIGSHWPFEEWGRFLPEQTTAVSILDRLLHHATVVITDGQSYRMKDAQHRKETPNRPKNHRTGWGLLSGHQRGLQLGH